MIGARSTEQFHEQLRYERERRGWSQEDLAKKAHCDTKTVGRWESGERLPRPYHRQVLCKLFGKDAEELGLVGLTPKPLSAEASQAVNEAEQEDADSACAVYGESLHEAPVAASLYGREKERGELERWLNDQSCRLIAVSGMGGMGKSVLVAAAATHLQENFECIFWRSLQTAPPATLVLKQCLGLLSRQLLAGLPDEVDDLLPLLLPYLRERRCLLVLDRVDSIMQAGQRAGCYREGYAAYGKLIRLFAETQHNSCLVLTSREKPQEIARLEGISTPVRSLSLAGIKPSAGRELLEERGLSGSKRDLTALVDRYSGNPLALQLASEAVREVFGGSIARFLQEDVSAFGEISDLLEQHFHRLSTEEREILYWLAIEPEGVSFEELREHLAQSMSAASLVELLVSLRLRSMIDSTSPALFSLPAVFKEYVTGCLIERSYGSNDPQHSSYGEGGMVRELVPAQY